MFKVDDVPSVHFLSCINTQNILLRALNWVRMTFATTMTTLLTEKFDFRKSDFEAENFLDNFRPELLKARCFSVGHYNNNYTRYWHNSWLTAVTWMVVKYFVIEASISHTNKLLNYIIRILRVWPWLLKKQVVSHKFNFDSTFLSGFLSNGPIADLTLTLSGFVMGKPTGYKIFIRVKIVKVTLVDGIMISPSSPKDLWR